MRLLLLCLIVLSAPPAILAQAPPPGVEVTGATFAELDEGTGLWTLRGAPVSVRRGAVVVRGPSIVYETKAQTVRATGHVEYEDAALTLTADEIVVFLQDERLVAAGRVVADQRADQLRLQASRLEVFGKERRMVATGGPVVTSREGTIEGERIDADGARDELTATGMARITYEDIDGRASRLLLRRREGLVILSGGAIVRQGRNEARGETVTVDLRRRRFTAEGGASLSVQTDR